MSSNSYRSPLNRFFFESRWTRMTSAEAKASIVMLLAFYLLALFLCSCARPKYLTQDVSPTTVARTSQTVNCDAHFSTHTPCVQFGWETLPTESSFGTALVKLVRPNLADQTPVPVDLAAGETLQVELWMPSMGHGSSPITLTAVDVGTLRATDIFFTMRGPWEFHFNVLKDGVKIDSAVLSTTF